MDFNLPTDIQERVADCLSNGHYQNEEEVLRDAMDALDRLEEDKIVRWHERNKIAQEQSEQELSKPLDDQAVLARLRSRLEAEGILG